VSNNIAKQIGYTILIACLVSQTQTLQLMRTLLQESSFLP